MLGVCTEGQMDRACLKVVEVAGARAVREDHIDVGRGEVRVRERPAHGLGVPAWVR